MRIPHDIIIRPIITEQSMDNMADGKYTFVVDKKLINLKLKRLWNRYLE